VVTSALASSGNDIYRTRPLVVAQAT